PPRRPSPDQGAVAVAAPGPRARGRAAVRLEPDAAARRPVGELILDARGAGKAAFLAPPPRDRPGKPGLDRRRGLVDVVAVEAQARFQSQRIAGAEAGELDPPIVEQALHDGID